MVARWQVDSLVAISLVADDRKPYRSPTQPRRGWPNHRGLRTLTLFEQWCGFFYVPQEPEKWKCCEKGPTIFRPYNRWLESLIVYRCHCKGNTFYSVKDPECRSDRVLTPRPPAQKTGALPTKLTGQRFTHLQTYKINSSSKLSFTCWHIGWLSNTRYW